MSQSIRHTITELEASATRYEKAAAQARQVAAQLRGLLSVDAPEAPTVTVRRGRKPGPKKGAAKAVPKQKAAKAAPRKGTAKTRSGKDGPSLHKALLGVLGARREAKAGGASARELFAEVQKAGYRFNSDSAANNMHYLRKVLRLNKQHFKRAKGVYSLA